MYHAYALWIYEIHVRVCCTHTYNTRVQMCPYNTCVHIHVHSKKNVKVLLFATDFNKMHAYVRPRETSKLSGFEDGRGGQSPGMRRRGDRKPAADHQPLTPEAPQIPPSPKHTCESSPRFLRKKSDTETCIQCLLSLRLSDHKRTLYFLESAHNIMI